MKGTTAATVLQERELGRFDRGVPGPLVLAIGGVHGNEPAGLIAAGRVLEGLRFRQPPFRGRFVALAGNLTALSQGRRYVDVDMNRIWAGRDEARGADGEEQRALAARFELLTTGWPGPVVGIDLHTSSADGPPFTCTGDTLPNRRLALSLPVPLILGLEEAVEGTLLEWFDRRGHASLAVEGGRHDHPATADNLEAALWLLLAATGALRDADLPDTAGQRGRLAAAATGMPAVVEILHREEIMPQRRFRMTRTLRSFDVVDPAEAVALDALGPVHPRFRGRILLPLYQPDGEDGFFLGRDVAPFWLGVARWARRLRLDRVVRLLPGVRRDPVQEHVLYVDRRIARLCPVQVFHLLGYRKREHDGSTYRFSRRFANARTLELG